MTTTERWAVVQAATQRLVRTVDGLAAADYGGATTLPGWDRAHVVAHLTLNAEALAGVLDGAAAGTDTPMYASQERRDADIAEVARLGHDLLRQRLMAATTVLRDTAEALSDEVWETSSFARLPDGPRLRVADVVAMRRREVEIHHADLQCGYGPRDWPEDFLDRLFNDVVDARQGDGGPAMRLRTPDGDVLVGDGPGPLVWGNRADLTWWLIGRGDGDGLTADPDLPRLGPW